MTGREYLEQARQITARLKIMAEQLDCLKAAAEYAAPQCSHMPKPTNRNIHRLENAVVRVMEYEERMNAEFDRLAEINTRINELPDTTHQALLVKRYICEKSWFEISSELHISVSRLYVLHRQALDKIGRLLEVSSRQAVNDSKE